MEMAQLSFMIGEFRPAKQIYAQWSVFIEIGTMDGQRFAIERTVAGEFFAIVGQDYQEISESEFRYWHEMTTR